jgi:uncharacterized protein (TIGR02679 family)
VSIEASLPSGAASPGSLPAPEPTDERSVSRIRETLSASSWRWLTRTVRETWEKDLSRQRLRVDLAALSDPEAAAMADFFGWPTHKTGTVTISLPRLDALLRASGLSAGLAACLTAAGGPLHDEAARRRAGKAARDAASDQLWAEAAAHPAHAGRPWLQAWLADERRTGRMPASLPARRQVLSDTLAVLAALPDPGTALARLATRILGHAHALDDGPVQAAILRALAWHEDQPGAPEGSARRRMLWASAGVALDTVSSTVLVLGLTLPGTGPATATLAANAAAGLPARLTLGQVRHYLDAERIPAASTPATVFACENPTIAEAAADSLGTRCAPLVCVEGRPSVAANLLLQELRNAGSQLHYHGDFDWPGIAIARTIIGSGALPWRFGAADYRDGLALNDRPKPLPTPAGEVLTPWDRALSRTMLDHLMAVEEETVLEHLLTDLAAGRQPPRAR